MMIMARETLILTLEHTAKWSQYYGYRETEYRLYKFSDDNGKIYVWKTSALLSFDVVDDSGCCKVYVPIIGDKVEVKATIKGESEYKGEHQIELTRVAIIAILEHGKTKAERDAERAEEQKASLQGEDFIWEMPYKQYKEHYADCETIAGSYHATDYEGARIKVIIREGRLKANGVRGQRIRGYQLVNANGVHVVYRAVSEENAIRRAEKEYPEEKWECDKIYW